jgi:hypothetical protein
MVVAVHDPRYREPLLLATMLPVTPQELRALYDDRWTVEQLPLAAKQMIGAARQFVHAPETRRGCVSKRCARTICPPGSGGNGTTLGPRMTRSPPETVETRGH